MAVVRLSSLIHSAAAGFEAARCLHSPPEGYRSRGWHGHSFRASLEAQLPAGWARFPGAEVDDLRTALEAALAQLEMRNLGDVLPEPTDLALAKWIVEQVRIEGWKTMELRAGPRSRLRIAHDGRACVGRRYRFEAAHRLPKVPPGHRCGRMHGHGFEIEIEASLEGEPEWILAARLDGAWAGIFAKVDRACLNDLEGLSNPTSEALAAWIWDEANRADVRPTQVEVRETLTAGSRYDGSRFVIWKEKQFDSATRMASAPPGDPLGRLHGHGYGLRLELSAPLDEVLAWVMDFGDVKQVFAPVFRQLDHQRVDELDGLANADCGGLATWIAGRCGRLLPDLSAIALHETPGCGVRLEL
jgi:6-pyruvoyltetrahydropterin/6-carboxytetrahydropterin synthase